MGLPALPPPVGATCCSRSTGLLFPMRRLVGQRRRVVREIIERTGFKREVWIAKSIGDLLAAAPRLKRSPLREHLRVNLSACIESATFGNLLAFADITRTSRGALRYWVSGTHRPQIGALLRMCYQIGVPVTQLLGDP